MLSRLLSFFRHPAPRLTDAQQAWVEAEIPFVHDLPIDLRTRLMARIPIFLNRYPFEGCDGLILTDEMRLTVAAYACRLRLGHDDDRYPDLNRILIYPDDYLVPVKDADEIGIVTETDEWRSGESWQAGIVILSWREIKQDLADAGIKPHPLPTRNLILHEFGHQLDFSYDLTSGIDPDTGETTRTDALNRAMAEAYIRLADIGDDDSHSALDPYGAEAPAELFAVAVEAFFETPGPLKRQYPELYTELEAFFNVEG